MGGYLPRMPTGLIELDISYSLVDGGLTDEHFAGLHKLEWALMDGNFFNSSIPAVFGTLEGLEYLYLTDSSITGDLSFMEDMPSIIELWVENNPMLSGPIYPFIGNLTTLESFSVVENGLVGPLPSEMAKLENLLQFWAYGNYLTGKLCVSFGLRFYCNSYLHHGAFDALL